MTLDSCRRYQKSFLFWIYLFLAIAILCLAGFLTESEFGIMMGIIGSVFSLIGLFVCLLFRKYYQLYEKIFIAFQSVPSLATWTIAEADWDQYQLIEKESRQRTIIKYILWSPALVALIAVLIWSEVDELSISFELLAWSVFGYAFAMLVLFIQMRVGLNKTKHKGDHIIQLKESGAQIDDNITYWGKVVGDEHSTFGQAVKALLFAKTDEESKINSAQIHKNGNLNYVLINYSLSENSSSDLYLPLADDMVPTVDEKLAQLKSVFVSSNDTTPSTNKTYSSKKYLKWIGAGVVVTSIVSWSVEQGLPMLQSWQANKAFTEALVLQDSGDYEAAAAKYKESVDIYELPESYLNLGVIYLRSNIPDSAVYFFEKALEVAPEYDLALLNKGGVYYTIKDYPSAITVFHDYENTFPDKHDHDLMMGDSFTSLEQYDSALFYYQRAYQEEKKSATLCYLIGSILLDSKTDEAITYLEESIQLDQNFVDSYDLLAKAYEMKNDLAKADEYRQLAQSITQ